MLDVEVAMAGCVQERGVRTSDGDGTVPVISTGLMCYKGWRTNRLNPANIPIVSREYVNRPTSAFKDLRYADCQAATCETH